MASCCCCGSFSAQPGRDGGSSGCSWLECCQGHVRGATSLDEDSQKLLKGHPGALAGLAAGMLVIVHLTLLLRSPNSAATASILNRASFKPSRVPSLGVGAETRGAGASPTLEGPPTGGQGSPGVQATGCPY